jgi:hypothetical protein
MLMLLFLSSISSHLVRYIKVTYYYITEKRISTLAVSCRGTSKRPHCFKRILQLPMFQYKNKKSGNCLKKIDARVQVPVTETTNTKNLHVQTKNELLDTILFTKMK